MAAMLQDVQVIVGVLKMMVPGDGNKTLENTVVSDKAFFTVVHIPFYRPLHIQWRI